MNNFKKLTIVGTICLSSLVATSVFAANTAKVTAETARMRSKASTDSSIVQLISMNEEVTIIEKSGDWYKIKYKGQTGYISSSLLDVDGNNNASTKNTTSADTTTTTNETSNETVTENTTNTEEKTTEETAATVEENKETTIVKEGYKGKLKSKVELRILPLINSSKILVLSENIDIEIVEVVNNWCSVKTSSSYGWVLKNNLESALAETTTQESTTTEENTDNTETEETKQDDTEKAEETTKTEETSKKEETTNTTKTGYINVDTVNVRKEKSTTSEILTNANKNVAVQILGEEDNWTKVKINGITGYIASKYISDSRVEVTSRGTEDTRQPATDTTSQATTSNTQDTNTQTTTQPTTSQTSSAASTTTPSTTSNKQTATTSTNKTTSTSKSTSSGNGDAVVAYAKQYLGSKYVSGGSSPSTGFDCSGFTSYVYKHFGKSISRTSSGQRSNGTQVNKSDLQKGDIVCFTGHVGIYIGDNKFIHAANPKKGVVITSLSDSYYVKNYITARRIK